MDIQRREQLAAAAAPFLDEVARAVEESWAELIPAAADWGPDSRRRARAAARRALQAILELLIQGDLDDRDWSSTRDTVLGDGHATEEEASELLRSVRVVGVELLSDRLDRHAGLTHDERWMLQSGAAAFCDELLFTRADADPVAVDAMLGQLYRSAPDLR